MKRAEEIIALTEKVDTAGAVVWWRLSGECDLGRLRAEWTARGLDEKDLPQPATPKTALRRAVQQITEKHVLARQIDDGWAIVREYQDGKDLSYRLENRFQLVGRSLISDREDATVASAYARHLGELSAQDISGWLVDYADIRHAVALRDTGGIYFVPRHSLDKLRLATDAIHAASQHKIYELPALKTSEAIDAIVEALRKEAENMNEEMRVDIESGNLGERALRTRVERCDKAIAKIKSYEGLLGKSLDDLRQKVDTLRAGIALAAMKAAAETDEAADV